MNTAVASGAEVGALTTERNGPRRSLTCDPLIKRSPSICQHPLIIRHSCDRRAASSRRIPATSCAAHGAVRDASDAQDAPQFASTLQAKTGVHGPTPVRVSNPDPLILCQRLAEKSLIGKHFWACLQLACRS